MKKIAAIAGLLVLGGLAQAQTAYGTVGYQSRSWEGSNVSFPGFNVGAAVGFEVAELGGMKVEPRVGFNYSNMQARETVDGTATDVSLTESTLLLDVLLKSKLDFGSVYFGPSLAYNFGTDTSKNVATSDKTTDSYSGVGYGVVLGAVYDVSSTLGVLVEGSYRLGNNVMNNKNASSPVFGVKLGVSYKF